MHPISLSRLAAAIRPDAVRGRVDRAVTQVCYDSRTVQPGALFLAQPGVHVDGHRFIDQAVAAGAVAVAHGRDLTHYPDPGGVTYLRVTDPVAALSRAAACFYREPSRELTVVGVTGTNGKSTTAAWIYHLLRALNTRTGLISTVGADYGRGFGPNPEHVTTPLAVETHAALRSMVDAGVAVAVIESSSWALDPGSKRLADVAFDSGVITNFSHDHLELHGSREAYLAAKLNLFRALGGARPFGVAPPELLAQARAVTGAPVYAFGRGLARAASGAAGGWANVATGIGTDAAADAGWAVGVSAGRGAAPSARSAGGGADCLEAGAGPWGCTAGEVSIAPREVRFRLALDGEEVPARLAAPAAYNLDNCLAAASVAARLRGVSAADLVEPIAGLRLPPGHLEEVDCGQPFRVIVDYAHTPEAFRATLAFAAGQMGGDAPGHGRTHGRTRGGMIVVFGSAGERDVEKRPLQGRIAGEYADLVVLTDEDCRGEDPTAILREIATGCRGLTRGDDLVLEPDRSAAIAHAVNAARPGDLVLLLGKGHEASMIGPDGARPWDERAAAVAALHAAGYAT